jgi:thiol-disulfide isomerase/thioredoxin
MTRYRNALWAGMSFVAISLGVPPGVFAGSPSPTSAAVKAATDTIADSNEKDVLSTVQQIREDVRALRQEVDSLRALLETQRQQSGASYPPERLGNALSLGPRPEEPLPATGVYFFDAEWCGPCRQMRPLVERLKREGLPILAVNADQHQDLLRDLHIEMLPTLVLMIGGKEKERATGSMDAAKLRALLAKIPNGPATAATSKAGPQATSNAKSSSKTASSIGAAIPPASTAPHDSPQGARGTAGKTAEYELRSYPVADLVVPTPGKPKTPVNGNLERLIGLLTDTIEPASWQKAGGKGQILQSDKTLSLIIRQTPATHRQVLALLRNLRALQSWQVCLELAIIENAPDGLLKRVGATCLPYNDPRVYSLSDEQRTALVATARQNPGTDSFAAKVTMFPGTYASIGAARNGTGTETIDIETIDSTDRYAVDLRLGVHDNKTGMRTVEPITVNVPNLKLVVMELKRTSKGPSTKPALLVVRPRFLFPVEEEEQQETPRHSELQPFESVPIAE